MLNISEIISKNNLENIRKEFQVEVILFLILQNGSARVSKFTK